MVFPMRFTKTPQYHDATNDTREAKQVSTIIYVITAVLSFFHGISHENLPKQLNAMMLQMTRVLSFVMVFTMKSTKTAQYHDATNDARDAKQLSTMMKVRRFYIQSLSVRKSASMPTQKKGHSHVSQAMRVQQLFCTWKESDLLP